MKARAVALGGSGAWPGRGDGQPIGTQGEQGARADRGKGLRASLPTALLAGPQPHRGGILEGEGVVAAGKSTIPRGLDRGDGQGVGCGDYEGHSRVLQALRLSTSGPTSMTAALGGELLWEATGYVVCVTILL